MIFCTFDGFRKNRPKSIYNRRSFYYNRNVRLFIKSASARRSKSAPVHSTVCLSYHVFHKKKKRFLFLQKIFLHLFFDCPRNICAVFMRIQEKRLPNLCKSVRTSCKAEIRWNLACCRQKQQAANPVRRNKHHFSAEDFAGRNVLSQKEAIL